MSAQVRPGYKLTEVGVIPEDWDVTTIGKVVNDFRGGAPLKPSEFSSAGVRVLPKGGVGYGGLLQVAEDEWQFCSQSYADKHVNSQVDKNYTVIVLRDLVPSGPSIGLAVRINDSNSYILAQGVYGFKVSPRKLEQGYIIQLSNTPTYRKLMNSIMVGSTQVHITNTAYKLSPIPLPPLPEQRAIATALSDMDALISGLDQLVAKKRDIKQATMQQLLTGQQRLPGFSGKWEITRLESISAFITKGSTPTTYGFGWVTQGIPFLRSECVSAVGLDLSQAMFISEAAHTALRRSEIKPGDLLMTITGNVGRTVFLDSSCGSRGNINQHIARIRITSESVNSCFVFHYLSRKEIRESLEKITTGQAYPQLSLKQVREIVVELPKLAEQTEIASVLSEMAAELAALETRRDKARQLKQGMMQELLTGRIRLL